LWLCGIEIDWNGFYAAERRRRVMLPTYPFERQRFWIDTSKNASAARNGQSATREVRREPDIADWFYVPVWKQSRPLLPPKRGFYYQPGLRWLIFTDDSLLASRVGDELMVRGENVTWVRKGAAFAPSDNNSFMINSAERERL